MTQEFYAQVSTQENENICLCKDLDVNVYTSVICNNQVNSYTIACGPLDILYQFLSLCLRLFSYT